MILILSKEIVEVVNIHYQKNVSNERPIQIDEPKGDKWEDVNPVERSGSGNQESVEKRSREQHTDATDESV